MTLLSEHAFPRHAHDQFGMGVMTLGTQRSWSVLGAVESGPGDIIMVNPGEMHDGAPMSGARGWHIVYLEPHGLMEEISDQYGKSDFVLRPVARDPQLGRALLGFFEGLESSSTESMATEETLLYCLMRAWRRHSVDRPGHLPASPPVDVALQRLQDAPEHPTSLDDLAALCGVNRFQFLRGFSRQTGATPHAYLVQLRVRKARRLLAAGKSPVEAALLTGFADQSHLTRAFVRQFGITPGRYRIAIG